MVGEWVPVATKSAQEGLNLFQALRKEIGRPGIKRIVEALSKVYFMRSGVLEALESAVQGSLSMDLATTAKAEYQADERVVERALVQLRSENISNLKINLQQRETLEMIRYEKISVRRDVGGFLDKLSNGQAVSSHELASLIDKIKDINETAKLVDSELRNLL